MYCGNYMKDLKSKFIDGIPDTFFSLGILILGWTARGTVAYHRLVPWVRQSLNLWVFILPTPTPTPLPCAMYVHMYSCVCTGWKPEDNLGHCSSGDTHFFFFGAGLSLVWNSPSRLHISVRSWTLGSPVSSSPGLGLQVYTTFLLPSHGLWRLNCVLRLAEQMLSPEIVLGNSYPACLWLASMDHIHPQEKSLELSCCLKPRIFRTSVIYES